MCGRYTITLTPDEYEEELNLDDVPVDFVPRYNVAPTQPVMVTRDFTSHKVEWMRWGLIPSWAKDMAIGARMINARSETLLEKPSFREAFQKRRCLILADGFYEWQKLSSGQASIPHYFYLKDRKPFFFAGLWDRWQSLDGNILFSCTIITGEPNELVRPIHERMPIILDNPNCWEWMNPSSSVDELQAFFRPYPADLMTEHEVSNQVNQPGIETASLIEKV